MMERIDHNNLVSELMRTLPELEGRYREEVLEHGADGPPSNYSVIGFVFKPQFKADLEAGNITDFLHRSTQFIERICQSGDPEAINVIWIKIFEWLLAHPGWLRTLWPVLGPATRANIRDASIRWDCLGDLPE